MDAAISYKSPTIISILIEFDVSIDVPVGSRRVSTAEDHVLWLSDIVILLGVDFRTRSVGHSSGKERSRISIKGEVLITKRTWKWIGKYLWRAVKRQGFPWAQIPAPLLENRNIINYNLLLLFFFSFVDMLYTCSLTSCQRILYMMLYWSRWSVTVFVSISTHYKGLVECNLYSDGNAHIG